MSMFFVCSRRLHNSRVGSPRSDGGRSGGLACMPVAPIVESGYDLAPQIGRRLKCGADSPAAQPGFEVREFLHAAADRGQFRGGGQSFPESPGCFILFIRVRRPGRLLIHQQRDNLLAFRHCLFALHAGHTVVPAVRLIGRHPTVPVAGNHQDQVAVRCRGQTRGYRRALARRHPVLEHQRHASGLQCRIFRRLTEFLQVRLGR